MREYTTLQSSLGESPRHDVNQSASQRLRKSGFWQNGKLRIGLLAVAATAALFIAGCGSSESEEVRIAPQATAPAEPSAPTTPSAEADPVANPVSAAEADIGFDASQTCRQDGEVPDTAEFDNMIAAAASLNEAFPNFSAEGTEGVASPAQMAAFILAGCEVGVDELQEMAQDGQIGAETSRLIQAVTSENLADFPDTYYESQCVRAGTENEDLVLRAPHRVRRVVTALRDVWLAVQQPEGAEFEQVMTSVSERMLGDIWSALVGEDENGDFTLKEQSEAEAAQIRQDIQQTCGYELVQVGTDA